MQETSFAGCSFKVVFLYVGFGGLSKVNTLSMLLLTKCAANVYFAAELCLKAYFW